MQKAKQASVYFLYVSIKHFLKFACFTRTIVYLSIVYTLGQGVLAVSAIHDITDHNRDGKPDDPTLHV